MEALAKELPSGKYYMDSRAYTEAKEIYGKSENYSIATDNITRIVNWDLLEPVIYSIISEGKEDFVVPNLVRDEIDAEIRLQYEEEKKTYIKDKLKFLQNRNGQPVITGKWRKEPYPKRSYEKVTDYVCASCLSNDEGTELMKQLDTPLNGFLGQAYNYDDYQLSEEWMVTFKDGLSAAPSENEIIRNQIESILELLTIQVQDKVCNDVGVLAVEPLGLGSKLEERYVWGMDCYTRRMVDIAIEDNVEKNKFSIEKSKLFVERKLLPAINAQQPENAHNMKFALKYIVDSHAAGARGYTDDDVVYANAVLKNIEEIGIEIFRIHPKGTGVICVAPEGLPPHVFISEYLGEMYPPYRWCERLDVIGQAQETFGLKPTLPDFYNILLERPRQDANGYNVIYVDASQKANMGSSCSHSCNSNLTTAVVARNGKLCIALCTTRAIHYGEELTMDYYSITSSEIEWRAAICLCGQSTCRGSFLNYATQDDLQQVLNQNCGPLWRYSSLLVACSMNNRALSSADEATLARHGINSAALGKNCPNWMKKYAADNLKFVELERKALPCALMRPKNGMPSPYTFSSADMDARIVMEQRLQSLICSYSMVSRVLDKQPEEMQAMLPLRTFTANESIEKVWNKVVTVIPGLLEKYLLVESGSVKASKKSVNSASTTSDVVVTDDMMKQNKLRIQNVIKECQDIIHSTQPTNMSLLRKCILDLRKVLLGIEDLSTATARVGLLADMLIFWANTTNFSSPHAYSNIESDPITVPARELGTNILRKNVCKEPVMKRFKEKASGTAVDSGVTQVQSCSVVNHSGAAILDPNEPVYNSKKVYSSMFTFYQLLDWYNAGTDEKLKPPELFGCVQLPEPAQCFGTSEIVYGPKQRLLLIKHLKDTKAQLLPWPAAIKTCFAPLAAGDLLYGSPMLDIPLGKVDAVSRVLKEFNEECNSVRGINDEEDGPQFDEWLAPENNVNWVQCEECKKWRRVAFHVDNESLPETWYCSMNFWDPDSASCSVPQDSWDTNAEVTLSYGKEVVKEKTFVEGSWWDVYCNKNNIYYEGQVKQIKAATAGSTVGGVDPVLIKFHFKGWSSKFDEWISSDSDRIKEHNLFTLPSTTKVNPRDQEKWQGFRGIILDNKKRKSIEGNAGTTSGKTDSEKKRKIGSSTRKKRASFSNQENSSAYVNVDSDEMLLQNLEDGEAVLFEPFIQG